MFQNLSANTERLREYTIKNELSESDLIEIKNLMCICETLIQIEKQNDKDIQEFGEIKRKLMKNNNEGFQKDTNQDDIQVNTTSEPLISSYDSIISKIRYKKMKEMSGKIDEIVHLNDYIECLVKMQGNTINNIGYRMQIDRINSDNTVAQLRSVLRKKKRKRRFFKFFCFMILLFLMLYFAKGLFWIIINKII